MFSNPRSRFSLRLLKLMRVRLDLVLERQFGSLLSERCRIRFAASRQVRRACVDQQDKNQEKGASRQT